MSALSQLHDEIEVRVQSIRTAHPDWLCAKGCDACCRQLAAVPQLNAAEWTLLQEGLAALTPNQLELIHQRIEALGARPVRPVTCPLLDPGTGACPVYAHRPVACRTYGFYVQRDKGLFCAGIEAQVTAGALVEVIWGNHETVEGQLAAQGEARSLTEWFSGRESP